MEEVAGLKSRPIILKDRSQRRRAVDEGEEQEEEEVEEKEEEEGGRGGRGEETVYQSELQSQKYPRPAMYFSHFVVF